MRDSIEDIRITAIIIEKSSSLNNNILGMKKTAKQMISNILCDFFIIVNSHLYGVKVTLESTFELHKLLFVNSL